MRAKLFINKLAKWSMAPLPGVSCTAYNMDPKFHGLGARLFGVESTEPTGNAQLSVRQRYIVTKIHSTWWCTCSDFVFRGQWEGKPCKHIRAIKRYRVSKLAPGTTSTIPVE